jgi:Mg-chelatase subunit ChlD
MSKESHNSNIQPELEARIIAMLLGEASDFEREELNRLIEQRPELAAFRRRMQQTHGLLQEMSDGDFAAPAGDWKLPADKRSSVLAVIRGEATARTATQNASLPAHQPGFARSIVHWKVTKAVAVLGVAGIVCAIAMSSYFLNERVASETSYAIARVDKPRDEMALSGGTNLDFQLDGANVVREVAPLFAPPTSDNFERKQKSEVALAAIRETLAADDTLPNLAYLGDDTQYSSAGSEFELERLRRATSTRENGPVSGPLEVDSPELIAKSADSSFGGLRKENRIGSGPANSQPQIPTQVGGREVSDLASIAATDVNGTDGTEPFFQLNRESVTSIMPQGSPSNALSPGIIIDDKEEATITGTAQENAAENRSLIEAREDSPEEFSYGSPEVAERDSRSRALGFEREQAQARFRALEESVSDFSNDHGQLVSPEGKYEIDSEHLGNEVRLSETTDRSDVTDPASGITDENLNGRMGGGGGRFGRGQNIEMPSESESIAEGRMRVGTGFSDSETQSSSWNLIRDSAQEPIAADDLSSPNSLDSTLDGFALPDPTSEYAFSSGEAGRNGEQHSNRSGDIPAVTAVPRSDHSEDGFRRPNLGMASPGTFTDDFDIQFQQGSFELGIPQLGINSSSSSDTSRPVVEPETAASSDRVRLRKDVDADGERDIAYSGKDPHNQESVSELTQAAGQPLVSNGEGIVLSKETRSLRREENQAELLSKGGGLPVIDGFNPGGFLGFWPGQDENAKSLKRPAVERIAPPAGLNETSAAEDAFSTLSLHVSDVSFKLALAALGRGEWPEAVKVRIEEFVNAFDYGDPMPANGEKVACVVEQSIHPFVQQRNLLRVSMRTAAAGRASSTPLRLTFLLDNSGSMERVDRQQTVRRAFALLAQQLTPIDQVTLISFARQPRLLADKVAGAEAGELVQLIDQLPSEGGTNIEAALQLAFEKAREQQTPGAQNRIILLTDGAVNLGNANPESLSQMVSAMRSSGIAFDAAGISADGLNDEVLEALTRKGDGRYYLLDSVESTDDGFARQIAGALRPSAKNVKVQVEFNPKRVGRYKLLGIEKHILKKEDFRNDKVDAAEMAAAEAGVAMYQFEAKPDGEGDVGSVFVRFQDLSTGQMIENRWPIPYEADAPRPDQAAPSLRIATAAALLAAKFRGEPLGESVDLQALSHLVSGLPDHERNDTRVQQLQQMIEQTRQLSGN